MTGKARRKSGEGGQAQWVSPFKTGMNTVDAFVKYYKIYTVGAYKAKRRLISSKKEVKLIARTILKTIRDHYLENEGGVFLRGLGYLCSIIKTNSRVFSGKKAKTRWATNGYYYRHTVLPDTREVFMLQLAPQIVYTKRRLMYVYNIRYKFLWREVKQKQMMSWKEPEKELRFYIGIDFPEVIKRLSCQTETLGNLEKGTISRAISRKTKDEEEESHDGRGFLD